MLLSLSLSLSFSTKLHPEQNGYVEWDKVDIESIDLPPSEDKYGIPSSDDEEDVGTQKDGGAGKDGASKEEGVSTAVIVDNLPQVPEAKFVKLTNVLTKISGKLGKSEMAVCTCRWTRRRRCRAGTHSSELRREGKPMQRWSKRMGTNWIKRTCLK